MASNLLKIKDLICERDDRLLFKQLNFELNPGEVLHVVGINGSGKTTLLRAITLLFQQVSGDILWHGRPVAECKNDFFASLLYLGHKPGINESMTPEENLRWYGVLDGNQPNFQELDHSLNQVGLRGFEDVPCHNLSAGQKRRVALARLYLTNTPLWILDEPFAALDVNGVAQLEALLVEHVSKGGAVVLTTHHELKMSAPLKRVNLEQYV